MFELFEKDIDHTLFDIYRFTLKYEKLGTFHYFMFV